MTRLKIEPKTVVSLVLASLLFISRAAWQNVRAQAASAAPAVPAMAAPNRIDRVPPHLPPPQAPAQPATLSPTLSYYFISGNTFTPQSSSTTYSDAGSGCVTLIQGRFYAPVHLPQASVVVSMTLYTSDDVPTTTVGAALFWAGDGQGNSQFRFVVSSAPATAGYQHQESGVSDPITIDNQNSGYWAVFGKIPSDGDSPDLALCGVRLAYYAPLSATFLPVLVK